jgi:parallel beta-helix repeat protein
MRSTKAALFLVLASFSLTLCGAAQLSTTGAGHGPAATAPTYYVSTSGNDANPCSLASPCLTIAHGLSILNAGDTLYIRGGTYGGANNTIDSQLNTVPSGTSYANAITIEEYPGETVVLQPNSGLSAIRLTTGAKSYIVFKNFTVDLVNSAALVDAAPECIYMDSGSNHIRMDGLELKNCPKFGLGVSHNNAESPFNEFINGSIHDCGYVGDAVTNGHGAYITADDFLIANSSIYSNTGYGLHFYNTGLPRQFRGDIHGNRIYSNDQYGIVVAYTDGATVYNNLIYGNAQGGMQVYTNTQNLAAYSNTIYNNVGNALDLQFTSGGQLLKNNMGWANGDNVIPHDYDATPGNYTAANNVATDPSFVNAAGANFHLASTSSTAYNVGATLGAPYNVDFDGIARPQAGTYDAGAYEFH